VKGDIGDAALLDRLFETYEFEKVFHCAAVLAHAVRDKDDLWTSNVDGTRELARRAGENGTRNFVHISSNCVYAENFARPVDETHPPGPVEIYGRSKLAAERELAAFSDPMRVVILRTPTIIEAGRLGLLAILFEFVAEGRRVWLVGKGANRYQSWTPTTSPTPVSAPAPTTGPRSSTSGRTT